MSHHQVQRSKDAGTVFNELYSAYSQAVYGYFLSKTGSRWDAEDLLQQTFAQVWAHIGEVTGIDLGRRGYWVFAVARNKLTDHYRRRGRRAKLESVLRSEPLTAPVEPDETAAARAEIQAVDSALRRLPEHLRTVLVMSVLSSWNSSQIGEALGIPSGTVRYRLHQARKLLSEIVGRGDK